MESVRLIHIRSSEVNEHAYMRNPHQYAIRNVQAKIVNYRARI